MSVRNVALVWLILMALSVGASFMAPERQRPYWYGLATGLALSFWLVACASKAATP
jgi:hypothetical protein